MRTVTLLASVDATGNNRPRGAEEEMLVKAPLAPPTEVATVQLVPNVGR
jgi:hypothetical protein